MRPLFILFMLALPVAAGAQEGEQPLPQAEAIEAEVARLVMQLGGDSEATREAARARLIELAGGTAAAGERLLAALPEPVDQMPAAVRESLRRVRREVADKVARLAVSASRVSLDVVQRPLSEVLKEIEKQTGNRVKDLRAQFGQQAVDREITIEVDDAPFFEALDQVLDEAGLGVYSYSGEETLALVAREPGSTPRWSTADYAGPLRIEPVRVTATRQLRQVSGESLTLLLEISWEPRLAPIAFSQPMADIEAENEDGVRLSMARPEGSIDLEASGGGQAIEMGLPMTLPTRDTGLIASLKGTLQAIVPGRRAEFRFAKLESLAQPQVQQNGGATVTLEGLRKNNAIWELRMRLKLDGAEGDGGVGDAFASHRGWVFNNLTYLVGKDENGDEKRFEHEGFETSMQQGNQIGLVYLFDLPNGPAGLTWVYQTPTAILRFPVEYELSHIPLP